MSFLYNESITSFFHRISSKEKPKKARKRKRLQEDAETSRSFASNDKKPKVQQKLLFADAVHTEGSIHKSGPSRQLAKASSPGESSKSLGECSSATPISVDALSRVSFRETPTARHLNPLPTPLTAKRPALAQATRSFLIPDTEQQTRTPRPKSPYSSGESSHSKPGKIIDLPTPVTMPRRVTYPRVQKSPQRSPTPSREFSSPEPSQAVSIYPLSSEYEESMIAVEEGQRDDYYGRDESPSPPPPSQNLVPSSQSQADGCFDSITLFPQDTQPLSASRHSPVFIVPRLPAKVTAGTSRIADDDNRGQTLPSQQNLSFLIHPGSDAAETSLIEIHDGEEYVLSSQSQLVLPFHVSPRKNRRNVSSSSSSSIREDTTHSEEIVPSSQSQLEKELDVTSKFSDEPLFPFSTSPAPNPHTVPIRLLEPSPDPTLIPPHALPVITNSSLIAGSSSQTHLTSGVKAPFSSSDEPSTSTQILVEETPDGYYDLLKGDEPGSATEEEDEDEGGNMFSPHQTVYSPTDPRESASSQSQESMPYSSSLPDAMKEFRDMFGVGDGSYPDDFPMSLRD